MLCVDDRDDGETFDRQFAADQVRRREFEGDEPRCLARFGPVLTSARAARATLLRAANAALLPEVVLLDHQLRGENGAIDAEAGLGVMAWIRDEFARREREPPVCVLCTARFSPGLAYAFIRCGGRQAIDKTASWSEQIEAIWQACDWHARGEGHWTHRPRDGYPPLSLPPSSAALLPYLDADVPAPQIAAALGLAPDAVHDRRGALVKAINKQVPRGLLPGMQEVLINGRSTSLARIAMDHGHVWVPLAYASLVAGGPAT